MTDPRTQHADREATAWAEFEAALAEVPRERWEETGALEGWTVKEMLWHVAGWLEKCATRLTAMTEETLDELPGTGLTVDERNARLAEEARSMDADAVWAGVVSARDRVRRSWERLPRVDDAAISELADETYEHYEEHVLDLQRVAGTSPG